MTAVVVDTSAFLAYLLFEPERGRLLTTLQGTARLSASAACVLEASMVLLGRRGPSGVRELDSLIDQLDVEIVPVTRQTAHIARDAFAAYGKGRHPAALNFGDCFSYALARERGEPLLFVGGDFSHTDLVAAPY